MTHEMRLNTQPFKKIKEGEKTIELRLYDEKGAAYPRATLSVSPAARAERSFKSA